MVQMQVENREFAATVEAAEAFALENFEAEDRIRGDRGAGGVRVEGRGVRGKMRRCTARPRF